jgi:hypothetical protein
MWFRKKKTKPPSLNLKIWGVIDGPYHREEVEGEEDSEQEWMLRVKISSGDEVGETPLWFDSYEDVYNFSRYFDKNIEPMELEISNES